MTDGQVLITGASGFVGSAVTRALLDQGFGVRVLLRATSPRTNLEGLDVEIVEGDIREPGSLARPMAGVQNLFHVAADYRLWAPNPAEIIRANREGTRNVMQAAAQAGVERIVYTSSVATIACSSNGHPADETGRVNETTAIGAYKRSKVAAEAAVEAMIVNEKLPVVVVHPSTPLGPRDIKPTPTGRIVIEAAAGRVPGYVDTGLNLVHVDDVAAGHVAALRRGKIGEHYILGGQDVVLADLLAEIANLSGRRFSGKRLPRALLYPFAVAAETMARVTHREPFLTLDGLRMSKHRMFFSSAKAEREIGYRARPYREGLVEALAWFQAHGYVR